MTPRPILTPILAIATLIFVVLGNAACSPAAHLEATPGVTLAPLLVEPGTETTTQPGSTSKQPGGPYYANCAAVRSAGKAPLHSGDPGYRSELDGDDDGLACE